MGFTISVLAPVLIARKLNSPAISKLTEGSVSHRFPGNDLQPLIGIGSAIATVVIEKLAGRVLGSNPIPPVLQTILRKAYS